MKEFNAISLFTGAGGMDLGFEKAGFKIICANEIVKEAADTFIANHPNTKMINDDINNVLNTYEIYRGNIDLVFGGPPCQGFSIAGKMDPNDARSKLIFTFLDVVNIVKPTLFVMENVKALGFLEKWESVRNAYIEKANKNGYRCFPVLLNASQFGVSQKRERVFFIGIKEECYSNDFEEKIKKLVNEQKSKALTVKELLKDLGKAGTEKNPKTCSAKITFAAKPIMRKSPYSGMYFNGQGRPIDIDSYANTLPASMGGNKTPFIDEEYLYGSENEDWVKKYHRGLIEKTIIPTFGNAPTRLRRITVREASRIQSFPDEYIFCGKVSRIYTQIGNAVPPKLAEGVAKAIYIFLTNEKSRV